MKIDKEFPERVRNVLEKDFFFYFFSLKVNISLIIHNLYLKHYIGVENTVSHIFNIGPGSFSIKFRKKYSKDIYKVTRFSA